MALQSWDEEVNGEKVTITAFPARKGFAYKAKLIKLILPAISKFTGVLKQIQEVNKKNTEILS